MVNGTTPNNIQVLNHVVTPPLPSGKVTLSQSMKLKKNHWIKKNG